MLGIVPEHIYFIAGIDALRVVGGIVGLKITLSGYVIYGMHGGSVFALRRVFDGISQGELSPTCPAVIDSSCRSESDFSAAGAVVPHSKMPMLSVAIRCFMILSSFSIFSASLGEEMFSLLPCFRRNRLKGRSRLLLILR